MAVITEKVGQVYSELQVGQDHDAIIALGWFQQVSVDRKATESGIELTFNIIENPVVTGIQFQGNHVLSSAQLLSVMQTKQGQVYNAVTFHEDSRRGGRITQLYASNGYILALVLSSSMSDQGVLTIVVVEGTIEAIRITGNTHTKDYVIRRYIRTKPGDVYNDKNVAGDVNRLAATRWFESVQRSAEEGSEPGLVVVNITLVERKRNGQATVGGGYSSVEGLVGFLDLSFENLWGTGRALTLKGESGGEQSFEMYYRDPWIFTPETRLNLGLYNRIVVREAFVNTPDAGKPDRPL